MKKSDIVDHIAGKYGISKVEVQRIIEEFMSVVQQNVMEGGEVQIRGFGRFFVKKRKAKIGRNISQNTSMHIPETYIPSFRPAKDFLEKVKKSMDAFSSPEQ